jgi:hypothetical protein
MEQLRSPPVLCYYILMKSSQWENLNHLFCRKVSFSSAPHCQFRGVGQGMKQTYMYLWYLLFQAHQWLLLVKLKSLLRKCYGRHHDMVERYGISVSQMTTDMFHLSQTLPGHFLIHYINTTGVTSGPGTADTSRAPKFTPGFQWG